MYKHNNPVEFENNFRRNYYEMVNNEKRGEPFRSNNILSIDFDNIIWDDSDAKKWKYKYAYMKVVGKDADGNYEMKLVGFFKNLAEVAEVMGFTYGKTNYIYKNVYSLKNYDVEYRTEHVIFDLIKL